MSINESSQFASGLILCAEIGGWEVEVGGENAEEAPYVTMTSKLVQAFPKEGGNFQIEPDTSSGSYFHAASRLLQPVEVKQIEHSEQFRIPMETTYFRRVSVRGWPSSGWQVDEKFPEVLRRNWSLQFGLEGEVNGGRAIDVASHFRDMFGRQNISRDRDLGDSILTAIVLAPFALESVRFTDLGRLRLQECERVVALRTELTKCGAKVIESNDTLEVFPSTLHGAEIETHNDHRMAMCFAILGLKVPGIKIKNPGCVKKTFPNFFQKLAAPPLQGLGTTICDAKTGRRLAVDELFAD